MVLVRIDLWEMYDLETNTADYGILATNLTTGEQLWGRASSENSDPKIAADHLRTLQRQVSTGEARPPDATVILNMKEFSLEALKKLLCSWNRKETTRLKNEETGAYYTFNKGTTTFITTGGLEREEKGGKKEEKHSTKISTVPTKNIVPTPVATTSTEQGGTITEKREIEVSTFTKYFKPGEVGVVGGKHTIVQLKNGDRTITLVFNPTSEIKITNLGDGKVLVEGRGRNNEWTKVIVNTENGTVTTESGELAAGWYRNWRYAAGKTQVQAPATGGPINLRDNQSTTLPYAKQLPLLTH